MFAEALTTGTEMVGTDSRFIGCGWCGRASVVVSARATGVEVAVVVRTAASGDVSSVSSRVVFSTAVSVLGLENGGEDGCAAAVAVALPSIFSGTVAGSASAGCSREARTAAFTASSPATVDATATLLWDFAAAFDAPRSGAGVSTALDTAGDAEAVTVGVAWAGNSDVGSVGTTRVGRLGR